MLTTLNQHSPLMSAHLPFQNIKKPVQHQVFPCCPEGLYLQNKSLGFDRMTAANIPPWNLTGCSNARVPGLNGWGYVIAAWISSVRDALLPRRYTRV